MQKNNVIFAGIVLSMMMVPLIPSIFAQYDVSETGLYKEMEKSKEKVDIATRPGAIGSGTPVFAADGVLGASIITAVVFGSISMAFFIKGRSGKYAAMGRG